MAGMSDSPWSSKHQEHVLAHDICPIKFAESANEEDVPTAFLSLTGTESLSSDKAYANISDFQKMFL